MRYHYIIEITSSDLADFISKMYMEANPDSSKTSFWDTLPPAGKVGNPEYVAGVVSFFASPDSRWAPSQVLRVDSAGTIG